MGPFVLLYLQLNEVKVVYLFVTQQLVFSVRVADEVFVKWGLLYCCTFS